MKQVWGSQDVAGSSLSIATQSYLLSPATDRWRKKSGPQGWTIKQGICHPDERSSSMTDAWASWDQHEQALFLLRASLQLGIPKPIVLRDRA